MKLVVKDGKRKKTKNIFIKKQPKEEIVIFDVDGVFRDVVNTYKYSLLMLLKDMCLVNEYNLLLNLTDNKFRKIVNALKNRKWNPLGSIIYFAANHTMEEINLVFKVFSLLNKNLDKFLKYYNNKASFLLPFPKAREMMLLLNHNSFIVSGANEKLLKKWFSSMFPNHNIKILGNRFDKAKTLYNISRNKIAYFITDLEYDIVSAKIANKKGANITPIGVLTGITLENDFKKHNILVYPNVLEAYLSIRNKEKSLKYLY